MVFGFFKKNKDEKKQEAPQLEDLVLSKLRPGYLVDYDMNTYQVAARNCYKWEEGGVTDEWELKLGDQVFYLERIEEDGYVEWSLCQKFSISELEGDIAAHIQKHEDPPETVTLKGTSFHFEEDDIGEFFRGDSKEPMHFVSWDYEDESGQKFLTIEQWGETKFDLTLGFSVEEYQFSNILPGEPF